MSRSTLEVFLFCALAFLLGFSQPSYADPDSMEVRRGEMPVHMNGTRSRQNSIASEYFGKTIAEIESGNVPATVPGWMHGGDPKWYKGNDSLGVLEAFWQDFVANLGIENFPSQFLNCFNFDISRDLCYKRVLGVRIPIGFKMSYRFPMQQIHTRRFFQNRYIPSAYYDLLENSGFYEQIWYNSVSNLHAPLAKVRAGAGSAFKLNTKSWAAYIPKHGPILPTANLDTSSFPLDEPDRRARMDGGMLDSQGMNQLEYSIGPTLMHAAWTVLAQYIPLLQILPCVPSPKIPIPFGSEDPAIIHLSREPFMGFALSRDGDLRRDLTEWLKNPAACQEWMMHRTKQNVPYDIMKPNAEQDPLFPVRNPLSFLISTVSPGGDPLKQLSGSQLARFDRMCTANWGGSIPFTTVHQVHDTPFISAGKNFEKAIRLGVAMDRTFISRGSYRRWFAYYPLHKTKDAYQLTYPEQGECRSVGTPGKQPFGEVQELQKPGEFGLYSMTHWWTIPDCCLKFSQLGEVVEAFADLESMSFPSDLSDIGGILSQVNTRAIPNLGDLLRFPSSIGIPGTGIPGMPTRMGIPSSGGLDVPEMPDLPF